MNSQDELDKISDRLREITIDTVPSHMDGINMVQDFNFVPSQTVHPPVEYVSLHFIYCPCELCAAVRYKEKLIRDSHYRVVEPKEVDRLLKMRGR